MIPEPLRISNMQIGQHITFENIIHLKSLVSIYTPLYIKLSFHDEIYKVLSFSLPSFTILFSFSHARDLLLLSAQSAL